MKNELKEIKKDSARRLLETARVSHTVGQGPPASGPPDVLVKSRFMSPASNHPNANPCDWGTCTSSRLSQQTFVIKQHNNNAGGRQ